MADVKTRAYYEPYDNDYYIPDAGGEKRVGKNENWRDIEKGFHSVQGVNDVQDDRMESIEEVNTQQDERLITIEAKNTEQDARLTAIEEKDTEQDARLDENDTINDRQDATLNTHTGDIAHNRQLIDGNTADIQTNATNIQTNATNIQENAADITTLSARLDTANTQLADNSIRLTRAENNITFNTRAIQTHEERIEDLENQAVIRLQATFDRQNETVTLTDPTVAYETLSFGHNAVIDLLIDNSFLSIYAKDINNSTNSTYRFTHAETGIDARGHGYTGLDAITITLDTVNETISNVAWSSVYNLSEERAETLIQNAIGSLNTTNWQNGDGQGSVKLPNNASVTGQNSIAAGIGLTVTGMYSAAFGSGCQATGYSSHAEGASSKATESASHAEGGSTIASGMNSHAEGQSSRASGSGSHTEGINTVASGAGAHAEGNNTISNHMAQHTFGEFNIADSNSNATTDRGDYIEIVGNGADDANRSNARTLDWSGNEVLAGDLTVKGGNLTVGSTMITEAQLIALLALLT